MELAHLIAFNATLAAAILSPGPALIYALRVSIVEGRRAGILTGIGLGVVAAMWTGLALLGLDRVFALVPFAYGALKIGGALYLLWVAWTTWRDARAPLAAAHPVRAGRAILRGAAINLANPKSVLFAAAVLIVIFPADLSPTAMGAIVLNHLAIEVAFYTILATALSRPAARAAYLGAKTALDRFAGIVLATLGLKLLFSRA
ncbi:Threonine/homoserine/homoserine lactone efflux protein [Palleronia marisminoris]|uniref:Threonine efflux protein n=1 Tax=Palleronia marisminoris TaxID=315423 RepID=A0A1Y5TCU0_9RHOB|nr:LysE family transporter [Palleronia marisminoris]SFH32953.1 Threonine/homoserine/homoserine lactone efflux protein [Palleronia marisminoris]SLN60807.1 Threonine efflux protein [Palleronia marisminoris]